VAEPVNLPFEADGVDCSVFFIHALDTSATPHDGFTGKQQELY